MHCNHDKSKPKTTHGIAKTGRCIFNVVTKFIFHSGVHVYLSKSPSVIQLSLNDKPTNRPESSDAWGSGAGLGGMACSLTVLLAAKLLFKYLQANIQSEEKK